MSTSFRVLVVDDDKEMRDSLEHLLSAAAFEVELLSRADQVMRVMQQKLIDVVLCDVRMPGTTGIELQQNLKGHSTVPLVLMSAHGDIAMAVDAIQNGAYSFLEKPFDPRRLVKMLENAAKLHRLTQSSERLKDRLADLSGLDKVLIGKSQSIETLRAEILDLSDVAANVMLLGETGTGKELVARSLHDLGSRAGGPFVALNCAAVPVFRFEEALFGAVDGDAGLLKQAEGGTLFVDELGAIPTEIQAKLLRVIETKQYSPVGSTAVEQADIRVVSAGNDRFENLVASGAFREDLYFRLNTIVLNIPPLRERRDDITFLYSHYLNWFASVYETAAPELTSSDIATLLAHAWPGNVRELRNACERHVLASRRGACSAHDALNARQTEVSTPETLREAVAAFERELIGKALMTHEGRMDNVAQALGIGRRTLNEKIVKLGLNKDLLLEK
jgi:two-component system C4-dicarboxylate transport response regulator DctD